MLGTERRVIVDAPAHVEAVVTDDPHTRTLRIHFLAYIPTPRTTPPKNRPYVLPGMIEDKPLFRATISSSLVKSAVALDSSTEIMERKQDNGEMRVDVVVEDVHDVVLLSY